MPMYADLCRGLAVGVGALALGTGLAAEQPAASRGTDEKAAADKPKPGPRLLDLRYDEGFAYLDGERESYQ